MNIKIFPAMALALLVASCGSSSKGKDDTEQVPTTAQSDASSANSAATASNMTTSSTVASSSSFNSSESSTEEGEPDASVPTDSDILETVSRSPESSIFVLPTSKLTVAFNQDLMINSINLDEAIKLEVSDTGEPVEGDIQVDGTRKIVFTPKEPLSQNVKYKANISSSIIAANGATYLGEEWSFQTLTEAFSQLGTTTQAEIDECGSGPSIELLSKFIKERNQSTDNRCGAHGFSSVQDDMLGLNCELKNIAKAAVDNSFEQYRANANTGISNIIFTQSGFDGGGSDNYASYSARTSTERIQYDDVICELIMNPSFTEFGGEYIIASEVLEDGTRSDDKVYFLEMSFR